MVQREKTKRFWITVAVVAMAVVAFLTLASSRENGHAIEYGSSFSKFHSDELGLPWQETYLAILDDLGVRKLRLSAHWPMVEGERDAYNFTELDYQMSEAEKRGAEVILTVGKRLPGWPECHVPGWAKSLSEEEFKQELFSYIAAIVERYKESPALRYWQVENEAFLSSFAMEHCEKINVRVFEEELELVQKIDPDHQIVTTDSGEFGKWLPAYKRGQLFGTTMYLYVWHHQFGPLRYPIRPGFFNFKQNMAEWIHGRKDMILIELGLEPWLTRPIIESTIEEQFARMGIDKFEEMIDFASRTDFREQYVWGAEWWYWLKKQGYPEHWEAARKLFK